MYFIYQGDFLVRFQFRNIAKPRVSPQILLKKIPFKIVHLHMRKKHCVGADCFSKYGKVDFIKCSMILCKTSIGVPSYYINSLGGQWLVYNEEAFP